MRALKRLEKPKILEEKETIWLDKFIESGNNRPSNSQYAHIEIKEKLSKISFGKCFYSEYRFNTLSDAQVDHYFEISEDKYKNKAFDWENLFLAHKDCNQGKTPNKTISNIETINPFIDSDEEIMKHLYFEDEIIKSKTEKGAKTIQKYNLLKFEFYRLKRLNLFKDKLIDKLSNSNKEESEHIINQLVEVFSREDQPFSLMFLAMKNKP